MDCVVAQRPIGRAVDAVGYSLDMLCSLPPYASSDQEQDLPGVVKVACRESWVMHLRLLVDFFLPPPPNRRDKRNYYVDAIDQEWSYPDDEQRTTLLEWHRLASVWVAHIAYSRYNDGPVEPIDTSVAALVEVAASVLSVVDRFCQESGSAFVEYLSVQVALGRDRLAPWRLVAWWEHVSDDDRTVLLSLGRDDVLPDSLAAQLEAVIDLEPLRWANPGGVQAHVRGVLWEFLERHR